MQRSEMNFAHYSVLPKASSKGPDSIPQSHGRIVLKAGFPGLVKYLQVDIAPFPSLLSLVNFIDIKPLIFGLHTYIFWARLIQLLWYENAVF